MRGGGEVIWAMQERKIIITGMCSGNTVPFFPITLFHSALWTEYHFGSLLSYESNRHNNSNSHSQATLFKRPNITCCYWNRGDIDISNEFCTPFLVHPYYRCVLDLFRHFSIAMQCNAMQWISLVIAVLQCNATQCIALLSLLSVLLLVLRLLVELGSAPIPLYEPFLCPAIKPKGLEERD